MKELARGVFAGCLHARLHVYTNYICLCATGERMG